MADVNKYNDVTPGPWTIVPTSRRTSKPDMVDVRGGEHGAFVVANYIRRSDAEFMVAALEERMEAK